MYRETLEGKLGPAEVKKAQKGSGITFVQFKALLLHSFFLLPFRNEKNMLSQSRPKKSACPNIFLKKCCVTRETNSRIFTLRKLSRNKGLFHLSLCETSSGSEFCGNCRCRSLGKKVWELSRVRSLFADVFSFLF